MTTDDAQHVNLNTAHEADPLTNPWGILTADPWPAGISMFHWYATEDALREALLRGDFALDAEADEVARAIDQLRPIVEPPGALVPSRAKDANAVVGRLFSIMWWGTFDNLCLDKADQASDLRADFRGQNDDDRDDAKRAVTTAERPQFAEFLKHWGY